MLTTRTRRVTPSLLLALIPACALVGGLPFVNRLEPMVFGLPFLLFWILAWVVATPVFLLLAYRVGGNGDTSNGASTEADAARTDGKEAR